MDSASLGSQLQNVDSPESNSFFAGIFISLVLYGILLGQAWRYFKRHEEDRWPFRLLMLFLMIIQTVSVILDAITLQEAMKSLISNPGQPYYSQWITFGVGVTVITTFSVQIYFAWKVYLMTKLIWKYNAGISTLIVSLLAFGSGIGLTVTLGIRGFGKLTTNRIFSCLYTGFAGLGDIIVTLIFLKSLHLSITSFKRTNQVIYRLIIFFVSRGLLVTMVQLFSLIMYLVIPKSVFTNIAIHFITGKVYMVTMMTMLNSRRKRRQELDDQNVMSVSEFIVDARKSQTAQEEVDVDVKLTVTTM